MSEHGPMIPLPHPQQRVGCYVLHLYCRHTVEVSKYSGNFWHDRDMQGFEITDADSRREAESIARKKGWTLHADGTSTCPHCARRIAAGEKPQEPKEKT
jgi:hypothetical protein